MYSTRALTLSGPGGIGKTRLAVRLLALMAREFPDGAWFVELADLRQPELVISRVATALGVSEEPGRPLLETLADVLRRRRLLLVRTMRRRDRRGAGWERGCAGLVLRVERCGRARCRSRHARHA